MIHNPDRAANLIEKAHAVARLDSERGYLHFLDHVVVDAQPRKLPFRRIAERWQWERASRVAPAIEHLAGVSPPGSYAGPLSFWNGYHKGSDKTHDTAREVCWLLGWSKKRLNMYVCAGDQDQAKLITTAMAGILQDNPWMQDYVHVTALTARGASGSELTVMAMDAYTGQGIFPDFVVAEEVTHWQYDEGRQFWDFILSSVNKRPQCVLKVNTNAGHIGSWQWDERNRVSKSQYWSFYEAPVGRPLATWMNQAKIDDDSQGMMPGERDRLYKNRWVDPGEEFGYITLAEAEACVDASLPEKVKGERNLEYFAVIDYGGVRDRCALALMHTVPGTDRAVVDRLDCWQGSHDNRVDIFLPENDDGTPNMLVRSVQGWLEVVRKNFRLAALVIDPNQLEGLGILYERKGLRVERFKYRSGQGNYRMAQLLKTTVQSRKVTWSPFAGLLPGAEDDTLAKELARLIIKPMAYGYRFDHESGRHDDRACAVAMGLVYAFPETRPAGNVGPTPVSKQDAKAVPEVTRGATPASHGNWADRWNIFGVGRR